MRLSFVPFLMGSLLLVACPGPPPSTDAGQPETDAGQWAIPSIDPEKLANYRKELGGRSFQDILAALRALPADRFERGDGLLSAMRQLTSLFVLQPSEASKVHEVLQSDLPHDAMSAFIGALSSASMPECVHALSNASLNPKLPPDVRLDAMSALGTAQWPTAEGFGALWSLSAPTDEDRALVLGSLGNTGLESALPLLREALEAENHELRANAVMGLRKIPGAGVDEVLVNALLHDTQWEVRQEAVHAISYRPIGAFLDGLRQASSPASRGRRRARPFTPPDSESTRMPPG